MEIGVKADVDNLYILVPTVNAVMIFAFAFYFVFSWLMKVYRSLKDFLLKAKSSPIFKISGNLSAKVLEIEFLALNINKCIWSKFFSL